MVYLDTNILIYLFENHEPYSERSAILLEQLAKENKQLITSVISVTEFLAGTHSSTLATLQQVPSLIIAHLDEVLAEQAAFLQRKHKVQIGDSIHLATAIQEHTESFFTNDLQLARVVEKYLPVISL